MRRDIADVRVAVERGSRSQDGPRAAPDSDSPASGEHRRFVTAIVVDAVGSGLFMPISMLYFLAMTDLSLVQVGAGDLARRRC